MSPSNANTVTRRLPNAYNFTILNKPFNQREAPLSKNPGEQPSVGSVVSAIAILRHLGDQPDRTGVNAIARAVNIGPSSCFNLLKTLVREEMVDFDPETKSYTLGSGLGMLAQKAIGPHNVFPIVSYLLEDLAMQYGVTMTLWRITPSQRMVLLGGAESPSAVRIHLAIGQRLPFLLGAAGRCVAACLNLPAAELAAQFVKLRWQNPPSFATYQSEVIEAKARGWSIDVGNVMNGLTVIAAVVVDTEGKPSYVVSAATFQGQLARETIIELGEAVRSAALDVGEQLSKRFKGLNAPSVVPAAEKEVVRPGASRPDVTALAKRSGRSSGTKKYKQGRTADSSDGIKT